jgi:hypothetical protein
VRRADPILVVCFAGAAAALLGLAWDVSIHNANPALANHESPLDILSPAHDLIVIGIVVAAAAAAWMLARHVSRPVGGLALLVVLVSLTWIGFTSLTGPATPTGNPQQQAAADQLWQSTEVATRRYSSLSAAVADGYIAYNPIADPLVHYIKPAYMRDGRLLDPEHVESLLYAQSVRGPVLVAAMYSLEDPNAAPPDVAGQLTPWHRHDDLCFTRSGEVVGAAPDCPPGSATYYTPWMLHVWLVPDRYGRFAADLDPWNQVAVQIFG